MVNKGKGRGKKLPQPIFRSEREKKARKLARDSGKDKNLSGGNFEMDLLRNFGSSPDITPEYTPGSHYSKF